MDIKEAINTRRSVRHFTDDMVSDTDIEDIIRAGMAAPSAGNSQPWRFVVMKNKKNMLEIPKFHLHANMLKTASVAIVVCADKKAEKYPDRWPLDCSAAIQNMLLLTHSIDLGAVWIGLCPDEQKMQNMRILINAPENIMPVAVIALGKPAKPTPSIDRFDSSKIFQESF